MTVLVASTTAAYKADNPAWLFSWLRHADVWRAEGHEFFLAAQLGHGHDDRLSLLRMSVASLGGTVWTFTLDEGGASIDNGARLSGICTGRNLAHEFAQRRGDISHVLFLDTDVEPPGDAIERLLEVDNGLVGFHVPTYGLDGPRVCSAGCVPPAPHVSPHVEGSRFPPDADVRQHELQTAGALMVRRDVFRALRWRWDLEAGMTDDPCFEADARRFLGVETWVRHDVVGQHWPGSIGPFDQRGHDLSIVR